MSAHGLSSLSSEELERIVQNATGEYSDAMRENAARELVPRLTVKVARKHFGHFVMPDCCGSCGARPVTGSTTVTASQLGTANPDKVSVAVPLCANCTAPLNQVEKAGDNPMMTFVGCFGVVVGIALVVALFLKSALWVTVLAITAFTCLLVSKAMTNSAVRSLPAEQRALYDRAKNPILMLHMGHEIHMHFSNVAFSTHFGRLNTNPTADGGPSLVARRSSADRSKLRLRNKGSSGIEGSE